MNKLLFIVVFLFFSCDELLKDDDSCVNNYNCGDVQFLKDFIDQNNLNIEPLEVGCSFVFAEGYDEESFIDGQTWENGRLKRLILVDSHYWDDFDESCYQGSITVIPESLGNLTALEDLIIYDTEISSLPESIANLESLKNLNISYNYYLTSLPTSITNLQNLESIYFEMTSVTDDAGQDLLPPGGLTSLPEDIGNLTSLNNLYVYQNNLTSLPASICNLPEDCEITLEYNKICKKYHYECLENYPHDWGWSSVWISQDFSECCTGTNDEGETVENWIECPDE